MRVKILRRLGEEPIVLDGSVVLVEDRFGNIVSASVELSNEAIECTHARDPHHNQVLRALGLDKLVICDRLELPSPPGGSQLVTGPGL